MALVKMGLEYIGPKGFLAEWRARRAAHASCKGVTKWNWGQGQFVTRRRHKMVVWIDEESSTCYCGGVGGQYVASRDAGTMLFKRVSWFEYDDAEAAEVTRREWEQEYCKQMGGGRWEWTTTDDEPGTVLPNGDILAARRRVYINAGARSCECGHPGPQHESDRAIGYGQCMYVSVGRTNDGFDTITARCSCLRYTPTPISKFFTAEADESRYVRPSDFNVSWEQRGGLGDPEGLIIRSNGVTVTMDKAEVAAAMSPDAVKEEIIRKLQAELPKRARREEGLV